MIRKKRSRWGQRLEGSRRLPDFRLLEGKPGQRCDGFQMIRRSEVPVILCTQSVVFL